MTNLAELSTTKQLSFSNNQTSINFDVVDGIYILEVSNNEGEVYGQKVEARKWFLCHFCLDAKVTKKSSPKPM